MNFRWFLEPSGAGGRRDLRRMLGETCRVYPRALDALDALFAEYLSGGKTAVILTTSQSKYVASCVTDAAARHGKWSRTFEDDAGIVVVIHEWGFVFPGVAAVKNMCRKRGVPLVEDCARSLGSYLHGICGRRGDYAVVSPWKFAGLRKGVLISRARIPQEAGADASVLIPPPEQIIKKRRRVFEWHCARWQNHKLQWLPRRGEVAEAFLLPCAHDGKFLRNYMRENGLEGGAWFGNRHLYLPCHQDLSRRDVGEIGSIVAEGLKRAPRAVF